MGRINNKIATRPNVVWRPREYLGFGCGRVCHVPLYFLKKTEMVTGQTMRCRRPRSYPIRGLTTPAPVAALNALVGNLVCLSGVSWEWDGGLFIGAFSSHTCSHRSGQAVFHLSVDTFLRGCHTLFVRAGILQSTSLAD